MTDSLFLSTGLIVSFSWNKHTFAPGFYEKRYTDYSYRGMDMTYMEMDAYKSVQPQENRTAGSSSNKKTSIIEKSIIEVLK